MVLSRWPPCESLTHIAWEINGPSISTESHSILNEYSQLDQQEAVVFGKWSLKDQSHKEEAKPSILLKEPWMNSRFPQFHMVCKERKSNKKKESYDV